MHNHLFLLTAEEARTMLAISEEKVQELTSQCCKLVEAATINKKRNIFAPKIENPTLRGQVFLCLVNMGYTIVPTADNQSYIIKW